MDDKNISLLISLMRAGITGQPIGEGEKENFTEDALNEVMKIAVKHDIGYIVGTGITASGLCEKGSETYEKIKKLQMSAYFRYERMKYDMQEIVRYRRACERRTSFRGGGSVAKQGLAQG